MQDDLFTEPGRATSDGHAVLVAEILRPHVAGAPGVLKERPHRETVVEVDEATVPDAVRPVRARDRASARLEFTPAALYIPDPARVLLSEPGMPDQRRNRDPR